jgi:hypothetical protein
VHSVTGKNKVFSVYSTGLETVDNYFNPTGYDYIIHCLGKERRENYVNRFTYGDFEFVQTPSMPLAQWLAGRNWYFYRNILNDYEKVYKTEYSYIWRKTESAPPVADIEYKVENIDKSHVKISVTSDVKTDFIAEFYVDYNVNFTNLKDKILSLNRCCMISSPGVCFDGGKPDYSFCAFPQSGTEFIPVKMSEGSGECIMTASYGDGVKLNVESVSFIKTYKPFYLESDYKQE